MRASRLCVAVLVAVVLLAGAAPQSLGAMDPTPQSVDNLATLSPYWNYRIQQWSDVITYVADYWSFDPDLLASLIWQESRGDATAIGPQGSVGLMQVMPREAGFSWRPMRDELLDPWVNVPWGSATLTTILQQGHGDIFNALAAYNGGWDKIGHCGPRRFATTILRDYASAVALRQGLQGRWFAFFAIRSDTLHGPIWVVDSARDDIYLYGDANLTPEGHPLIPDVQPLAIAVHVTEESGAGYDVGIWFHLVNDDQWATP